MESSPGTPSSTYSAGSPAGLFSNGGSPCGPQAVSPTVGPHQGMITPYLRILNQPQSKFRFRYVSEMTGTHGCLMAESKDRNKKEYIRVQLVGCQEEDVTIRCTLVTNTKDPVPHVHRLGGEGNPKENEGYYQDVKMPSSNQEWIATFSGLTIIHTAKKQVREMIEKRLLAEEDEHRTGQKNRHAAQQIKDKAEKLANSMDLHSVKLKFEAFIERNGRRELVSPPIYSQAIHNLKSTHAGDLRIVRIDKVYSCCTGQEEIFIFVEKVNKKDIKIKFFETDDNEMEVWSAYADFSELDVHHQYAIAFKTPEYRDLNIQQDVEVQFQLYRPSNGSTSEPKLFTYTPREVVGMKRPRRDPSSPFHVRKTSTFPTRQSPPTDRNNAVDSTPPVHSPFSPSGSGNGAYEHHAPVDPPIPNAERFSTVDYSKIAWNHPVQFQNVQQPQQQPQMQNVNYQLNPPMDFMQIDPNAPIPRGPVQYVQPGTSSFAAVQQNTGSISHSTVNYSTLTDDLLREILHYDVSAPQQNGPAVEWNEIQLDQNDDDLLRMLISEFNEYSVDASRSSTVDCMAARMQRVTISKDFKAKTTAKQTSTTSQAPTVIATPELMSKYTVNMAKAVRWYAETGDLMHILTRMRHLMAMQSEEGDNALHGALMHSQIEVVRVMLRVASQSDNGLQFINSQNNASVTPLHIAVSKNQTEATALLLQHGADPNLVDSNGNTPIHIAAGDKDLMDCLHLLLSPNLRRNNALKIDARNYSGLTPLLMAVEAGNVKGLELLISRGADVNIYETKRGRSALHFAVKKQAKDIIQQLIKHPKLNVNAQSYDGNTALHLAVMDELHDICSILVNEGKADATVQNYISSSSSFSDSDNNDQSDDENSTNEEEEDDEEDGDVKKGQTSIDLAQSDSTVLNILRNSVNTESATPAVVEQVLPEIVVKKADKAGQSRMMDSGVDLMASKDLSKDLDEQVIADLAKVLYTPNNEWEKLADSLDLGDMVRSFSRNQPNPAVYLLENLDVWEVSAHAVLEKLHQLQLKQAASILEEYLLQ